MDIIQKLIHEIREYGMTLVKLQQNNKELSKRFPKDAYFIGKVDAYEVAANDLMRRLEKVVSYFPDK